MPRDRLHRLPRIMKHYSPNWQKEWWQTSEETSRYVRPERVNRRPNSMTDIWWWWWLSKYGCVNRRNHQASEVNWTNTRITPLSDLNSVKSFFRLTQVIPDYFPIRQSIANRATKFLTSCSIGPKTQKKNSRLRDHHAGFIPLQRFSRNLEPQECHARLRSVSHNL